MATADPKPSVREEIAYESDELWRIQHAGGDSIHLTKSGGIGIQVGGLVIVKSLRGWHELAQQVEALQRGLGDLRKQRDDAEELLVLRTKERDDLRRDWEESGV